MLTFVATFYPFGFRKAPESNEVPRVRFEAISVGSHLALQINPRLKPKSFDWLESQEFQAHTRTDASNSAAKLRGRVEYVRDKLLGR
jgi:hypothetical protein